MSVSIIIGDCRKRLAELEAGSVHCCVTSPPYFGLRDYGVEGQMGLEPTPDEYVADMVALFREVRRVLRDDGTLWLNIGDSYNSGSNYSPDAPSNATSKQRTSAGTHAMRNLPIQRCAKPKDLLGIPWLLAFALRADGWFLRQDIIWSKPNPMPESVRDRCTKAHEYLFLLSKSPRYNFNADAIADPAATAGGKAGYAGYSSRAAAMGREPSGNEKPGVTAINAETRNKRSVWEVTTQPFSEAHFATFPPDLIQPCILAGCPEGGTVLDPFGGAGTTGLVADRLQRNAVLIELNPAYAEMARRRIDKDRGALLDAMESAAA